MMRSVRLLVLGVAILAAGCGTPGVPEPSETLGTEDEQLEAEPTPTTVGCDLLTIEEVSSAVGRPIEQVEEFSETPGGFGCIWTAPNTETAPAISVSVDVDPVNVNAARANIENAAVEEERGAAGEDAWWGPLDVLWIITDEEFISIWVLHPGGNPRQEALLLAPRVLDRLD